MKQRMCVRAVKISDIIFYCEGVSESEVEHLKKSSSVCYISAKDCATPMYWDGKVLTLKEWKKYKVVACRDSFTESDFYKVGEFGTKSYGSLVFKNCVGKALFKGISLIIESDKISESEMNDLIEVVNSYILNLSYDFNTATFSNVLRNRSKKTDISYHKYLLLRDALTSTQPAKNLFSQFNQIESDPLRSFITTIEYRDFSQCDTVSDEAIEDIFSGNSQLKKCSNANNKLAQRLKIGAQNYVPSEIAVEETIDTFNNPENQFIRFFVEWAIDLLSVFNKRFASYPNFFDFDLIKENSLLIKKLKMLLTQSFLRYVGTLHSIPMNSTVLTKKNGYRQFFQLFIGINALPEVDTLQEDIQEIIENKSLDVLYENYCFFGLSDVLARIYGVQLAKLKYKVQKTEFSKTLEKKTNSNYFEFAATGNLPKVRIHYNKNYVAESYSKAYDPDISLEIYDHRDSLSAIYVFDSKFRVNFLGSVSEGNSGEVSSWERKLYKYDDISKMHTYRDAIKLARGAFIIYPGSEDKIFYEDNDIDSSLLVGVGAFFVSPGKQSDWDKFMPLLRNLLKHFCYED